MRYRRMDVAGGTYFFTVNLAERKRTLLVDHIDILRAVIQKVKSMHPFRIDAMVILPDHLHTVWTLPVGDCDYPMRWMLIKGGFSQQIPKDERNYGDREKGVLPFSWRRSGSQFALERYLDIRNRLRDVFASPTPVVRANWERHLSALLA